MEEENMKEGKPNTIASLDIIHKSFMFINNPFEIDRKCNQIKALHPRRRLLLLIRGLTVAIAAIPQLHQ
jgi:hypothetical protein